MWPSTTKATEEKKTREVDLFYWKRCACVREVKSAKRNEKEVNVLWTSGGWGEYIKEYIKCWPLTTPPVRFDQSAFGTRALNIDNSWSSKNKKFLKKNFFHKKIKTMSMNYLCVFIPVIIASAVIYVIIKQCLIFLI